MRVISNIKDFYDFVCYVPNDPIVFERTLNNYHRVIKKEKIKYDKFIFKNTYDRVEYDKETLDKLNKVFAYYGLHREKSIIIIGEKLIPFLTFTKEKGYDFIYSVEEYIEKYGDKNSIEIKDIKNFFERFKENINLYNDIRKVCDSPVITYSRNYQSDYSVSENEFIKSGANFDSILKNFKLQKYMNAYIVAQEISLFLNKNNNKELSIELGNDYKIKAAGFDNNSFKRR